MLDRWRLNNMILLKHGSAFKMSKHIDLSDTYIYQMCEGKRQPSVKTLEMLADHFNCSTDYLLGRADR